MGFNLTKITHAVTSTIGRQKLIVGKNSPHVMFGMGVVGVAASTVLACRSTLKLEETLDETQDLLNKAKMLREREAKKQASGAEKIAYSEMDYKKDLTKIYIRSAVSVGRLYAPAFLVGGLSIAALTGAHVTMTKRNASLTAAYATIDKAFKEYRKRVIDDVGEEKEREYYQGVEVREVYSEKENGEPVVEQVGYSRGLSPYAVLFDSSNKNWTAQPDYNIYFLRCQQAYWNTMLQSRGHVFLNEVYDMLGLPHTKAGAVVGWVKGNGDNYVDFGIFSSARDENMNEQDFINTFMFGKDAAIYLDFNVDGVIYDKI